jgi:hypothetical protein
VRFERELAVEVRVPSRDDRLDREQTCMAVIGMQPVRAPGVVPEHDVGPDLADDLYDGRALVGAGPEISVDKAQEVDGPRAEHRRCIILLGFALLDERGDVGIRIPCALGAVGADAQVYIGACRRPLGQRRAAAELDVVGMGTDRKNTRGASEINRRGHDCVSLLAGSGVPAGRSRPVG